GTRLLFSAALSEDELHALTEGRPAWNDERPGRRRGDADAEPDPDGTLAEIRAWLDRNSTDGDPRVFTRLDLQGELGLETAPTFRHYFVLATNRDDAEPQLLTRGFYSYTDAEWLPDGSQILVSGPPEAAGHPDRERDRDLFLVDADGGRLTLLLDLDGYALGDPLVSPDGNLIAFTARALDDLGYAQTELGVFALDGQSPPELLTLGFDRSLYAPRWSRENWFLYFVAPSEGGFPLFRLPVFEGVQARPTPATPALDSLAADTLVTARARFLRDEIVVRRPQVDRLTSPEHGVRSYDLTGATAYYVLTEALNPYELYAATMEFASQRRLTGHNAAWLASKRVAVPEAFTLRRDTLEIPYWVMRPPFFERRASYPMLLEIHGGPSAMWGPGEASMWLEFQLMAAQGYGVVYSNPRGSGGYGHAYKRANYQDWGEGPASDVLAVATEAVRRNRWLDEDRQVVTGGSYAGYLTAWIVAHDRRFKAAVAQRGVYDLATFFGEGNAWRLIPGHFGGYPWDADTRDVLAANSPLTFVDQITTPLLIIHGDNDLRTGVIQSEVLYKSLKALERPVEYVRYPRAGHELSRSGDPTQRMDRLLRIYEFMERYVGDGATTASD
ncbi:MAG: S9 family peptidase, partial [Rhodothermales bacterium]|nr:S9 family peptidase [Rhodothermales bacterium]